MVVLHRILAPLVIVGVLLSTLHQSTLGTLFTIVPHKLHPLWYSPILPVHFFISCLAAGLAMICFEGFLSWRFLGHPPRMDLLPNLARVMALILVVYFVFRIEDLALRNALSYALVFGMPALLFWLENTLFVIVPVAIVFRPRMRRSLGAARVVIINRSATPHRARAATTTQYRHRLLSMTSTGRSRTVPAAITAQPPPIYVVFPATPSSPKRAGSRSSV
jgi:Ni/Fe-hydrogenase subunit HybB-like protein